MFSGLWPRNIPYCAQDEPPRPGIKINSGACEGGARVTRIRRREEKSEFMALVGVQRTLSRFIWLTSRKWEEEGGWNSLLRGSPDEKASRKYDLRTGSGSSLLTAASSLFLLPLLLFLFSDRVRAIRKSTFVRSRYSSITRIWKSSKVTKLTLSQSVILAHGLKLGAACNLQKCIVDWILTKIRIRMRIKMRKIAL